MEGVLLPTTPEQRGSVQKEFRSPLPTGGEAEKDLSGPSTGLITARLGPGGTKAWAQRELRRHHQAEPQGVPRAALDSSRLVPERQMALCRRCGTHYGQRAFRHTALQA